MFLRGPVLDPSLPKYRNLVLLLLGTLVLFALGVALRELRPVLLPFVTAVLLSILFKPIVVVLQQRRYPRLLALAVVLLSLLVVLFLFVLVLYTSLGSFLEVLPRYEAKFDRTLAEALLTVREVALQMGVQVDETRSPELVQLSTITRALSSGVGSFLGFAGNAFLVVLFVLFVLAGSGDLATKVEQAFPSNFAHRIAHVIANIERQVRQYLVTKTLISAVTGVITTFILLLTGVDFALLWGFLTFLLNFIPNLGSIVATLLPVTLALLQFDTLAQPLIVLVLLGITQVTIGNVLDPRIMAFSLNLSPLFVLVSLIFWGWLWGIWGMLLAVPITATIKIICENVGPLHPLAVLMGGPIRPTRSSATPPPTLPPALRPVPHEMEP